MNNLNMRRALKQPALRMMNGGETQGIPNAAQAFVGSGIGGQQLAVDDITQSGPIALRNGGEIHADVGGMWENAKRAMTNQARADQYKAVLSGYETVARTRGDIARTKIQVQGQLLDAFKAKVQTSIGNAQVQQSYYKVTSDVAIANARGELEAQVVKANSMRDFGNVLAQLGTANAKIYSGLASSAMAGMNTLAAETKTE